MRQGGVGLDERVAPASEQPSPAADRRRRWAPDAVGLAWTVAGAFLVLLPALRPGISLGPFDLLSRFGLTANPGLPVHNAIQADQIQQFVPWLNLAWHQVHHGQLPLWNPDNGVGMPLAFNWQSSVFSLPMLVGYLFPVHFSYTAVILAKLVAAGTGGYVLCRVLGMSALAAAFGGTVFELSGPIVDHAGWPHTSVTCWAGWILAAAVLLVRGRHRFGSTVLLAFGLAFAVYGGHPESLIVLAVASVIFVVVTLVVAARTEHLGVWRPGRDLLIGTVCGAGLAAPLLFPGIQTGLISARRTGTGTAAFPLSHLPNVVVAGLQGADFKTAAYVGPIVVALALVGLRAAWRRPEALALAVVAVVTGALTFVGPFDRALHVIPGAQTVAWSRSVMLLALALAVLGAYGLDAIVRAAPWRAVVEWAGLSFVVVGVVVAALAVLVVAGISASAAHHKSSLVWPVIEVVVGLGVVGWAAWWSRGAGHAERTSAFARRAVAAVLLVVESAFLVLTGVSSWSLSSTYFPTTAPAQATESVVGDGLVGYGSCRSLSYLTAAHREVGIRPNANIGYGIRTLAVYDPIVPSAYFSLWTAISGLHASENLVQLGEFCPKITTAAQARVYGVRYVLEPPGRFPPAGMLPISQIGDETVYEVPGSGEATTSPLPARSGPLPLDAPGTVVPVTHRDATSWRLTVDDPHAAVLRLRLTAEAGWNATVDGRPLTLSTWADGAMLQAVVPGGRHVVELHYWPSLFSAGIGAASAVLAAFVVATGGLWWARRRRRPERAKA
ncbi:MAG TPA: YfhO family protein [Acidimicrobiales bacterium]|nr:YfhO family protein [Acidimicrobiales bacterium]